MLRQLFIISILIFSCTSFGFTTLENSTSVGFYRDYRQDGHYPLYHSWSLHGYYPHAVEATFNIYINNDFSVNDWSVFATQAEVDVPLSTHMNSEPGRQSRLKLGRQIFTEGFDFSLLDGVQAPLYWSAKGGVMPIAGYLRSPDVDQPTDVFSPILGAVVWQRFNTTQLRGGYTSRDEKLSEKNVFASVLQPFDSLPWSPQILYKQEWDATDSTVRQLAGELQITPSDKLTARLAYSDLAPRPIRKKDISSFVYRLFAISPTRSSSVDFSWQKSAPLRLNLGATQLGYDSGYKNETANRQDVGADVEVEDGRWLSFVLTHLETYGGQVIDAGTRFAFNLNNHSQIEVQYDLAHVDKIDGIKSWDHHVRTGYERQIADNTTALFGVEGERNPYFHFDLRTMVYVTSYY